METIRGPGDGASGEKLVTAGLDAIERGEQCIEALLAAVGAPRLRALGTPVTTAERLLRHARI